MKFKDLNIEKTYVINLDRNREKWEFSKKELMHIGLNPCRISAWDGLFNKLSSPFIDRPGGIGCMISHWMCLQSAVINDYECIAIFEDDIILHPNFEMLEAKLLEEVPQDWEILWLGWDDRDGKREYISKHVLKPNRPYGTQAIIYRGKDVIRKCFEMTKKIDHWDLVMERLVQHELKCYLPCETLFEQRRHLSDIYIDHRPHFRNRWYINKNAH